jgi:ABC-type multidrug transport system ATPase subunit
MIYCFSPVSARAACWAETSWRSPEIKARLGVKQEDNLDPDLSVHQNLVLYAGYFDIPKAGEAPRRRASTSEPAGKATKRSTNFGRNEAPPDDRTRLDQ